jgi:hypothetical protein
VVKRQTTPFAKAQGRATPDVDTTTCIMTATSAMRVILRIATGPLIGRNVLLLPGQSVQVGRTEFADFAVPHDGQMSSVHFALRCDSEGCRVQDLHSTNGTRVNGERIVEQVLHHGDTIVAGQTTFTVQIEQALAVAPAAPPTVGRPERPPAEPGRAAAARTAVPDRPAGLPVRLPPGFPNRPYDQALADEDPAVRRAALLAAAWTGERWLRGYCRGLATNPSLDSWDALWLLAVLGQPEDLELLLAVGRTRQLGSRRFQLYASYGHPGVVRELLLGIDSQEPPTAVAAGVAFTKITGVNVDSSERVELAPEEGLAADEFEQALSGEVFLPSLQRAELHWQRVKQEFAQGVRWRRGINVGRDLTPDVLSQLDLEGCWEACLRGRYEGTWQGTLQELEGQR